jgi:hypothetical protein
MTATWFVVWHDSINRFILALALLPDTAHMGPFPQTVVFQHDGMRMIHTELCNLLDIENAQVAGSMPKGCTMANKQFERIVTDDLLQLPHTLLKMHGYPLAGL